jgi:hypothetical protein
MKTKIYFIFLALILLIAACSKNNFETGINGTIKIGYGDCMPIIDTTSRTYENFSGKVYFVRKSEVDASVYSDIQQLKENSIYKKIKNGKLSVELPADTFYVLTDDINSTYPSNMVVISSGQVLQKDFEFWVCTSY